MVRKAQSCKSRALYTTVGVAIIFAVSGCTFQETYDFFHDPEWQNYRTQGQFYQPGGDPANDLPSKEDQKQEVGGAA